jgi:hypothetical protein
MSIPTEIQAYLVSLGTLGTIVIGSMPASPNVIGVLYEYGGQAPERRFGVSGVGYEHPAFQLIFRGEPHDYAGPRAKAEIAWRALMSVQPRTLGTTQYLTIDPQQSPFAIRPQDENNRHYVGCNFYATKEPS